MTARIPPASTKNFFPRCRELSTAWRQPDPADLCARCKGQRTADDIECGYINCEGCRDYLVRYRRGFRQRSA